jgi:hypothetical protein
MALWSSSSVPRKHRCLPTGSEQLTIRWLPVSTQKQHTHPTTTTTRHHHRHHRHHHHHHTHDVAAAGRRRVPMWLSSEHTTSLYTYSTK